MFFAGVLCIWVSTTLTTTSALQVGPELGPSLLSRLDRLEGLLADHQVQLHYLQGKVLTLQKEKQSLQIQTQTLTAEKQALKTELGEVHQQLVSMSRAQQSLQDLVTQCGITPRPDREGDGERGDGEHHQEDGTNPIQDKEESRQSQHVHKVRSDDHNPLEAVTDRLAQQMTQLTADVQALKTQHTADIQELKASDAQQHQDVQAARGSTFVQWGSSTCAGSSELVYAGVLGGSWYDHRGAAANALCLSLSPKLLNWPSGLKVYAALYGGEYQTYDAYLDRDTVCAVCRSVQPTTIMVPGTNVCSAGWTLQYSGFLMAGRTDHPAASQYICVDAKMGSVLGSQPVNNDGYLLYYTKTYCGSLPCPPYEAEKLVTCAVCSK